MSILTLAKSQSVWRGYEYFKGKNVLSSSKVSDVEFQGCLKGSGGKQYETFIDIEHPRKSKCNCPHADGKK